MENCNEQIKPTALSARAELSSALNAAELSSALGAAELSSPLTAIHLRIQTEYGCIHFEYGPAVRLLLTLFEPGKKC